MKLKMIFRLFFLSVLAAMLTAQSCSQTKPMRTADAEVAEAPAPAAQQMVPQKHSDEDFSMSCFECHAEVTPEITEEWTAGKHGQLNVGCFICHGDGQEEFWAKPTGEQCATCHAGHNVDFSQMAGIENCFTCHGGHDLKFHPEKTGGFGTVLPQWLPADFNKREVNHVDE